MNTPIETKSIFVRCTCSCQTLQCEIEDYGGMKGEDNGELGVNFTMWNRSRDGKKIYGWKEKFRWCWRIITTGNPWADDIIVTNKNARGLAEFILQNLPNEESNEANKNK